MKKIFRVEGIDCANCAAKVERAVAALDGVSACSLSFMTGKLIIEADDGRMEAVVDGAKKVLRKLEPDAVMK